MHVLAAIAGIILCIVILQESIETIVLPRRVARRFRLTRLFYRSTWKLFSLIVSKIHSSNRREYIISFYGPLSLLLLLVLWAISLILAFALLQWSLGSLLSAPEKNVTFLTDLYMSGTTFFTLGLGDVTPQPGISRVCTVIEGGLGFGFLALVIGYVPIIYQAFSRREAQITLLDAHAGSPPSVSEFMRRHSSDEAREDLPEYLRNWEHWSAEILESHLSYPVLVFYRSQHDRQSWLTALTTILDISALIMVGVDGIPEHIGRFTFAIARHTAVDLAQTVGVSPTAPTPQRLSPETFTNLQQQLREMGLALRDVETAEARLAALRDLYEPYVNALATYLHTTLPTWLAEGEVIDDWQTSAWDHFMLTGQRPLSKVP